jgi:hypothetical protein
MIFSAGPCSVCGDAGDAVFVRARGSGRIFFLCPECGIAWARPPQPYIVDTIDPPSLFAPSGFSIATHTQIRDARLEHLVTGESPDTSAESLHGLAGFCPVAE